MRFCTHKKKKNNNKWKKVNFEKDCYYTWYIRHLAEDEEKRIRVFFTLFAPIFPSPIKGFVNSNPAYFLQNSSAKFRDISLNHDGFHLRKAKNACRFLSLSLSSLFSSSTQIPLEVTAAKILICLLNFTRTASKHFLEFDYRNRDQNLWNWVKWLICFCCLNWIYECHIRSLNS